MDKKREFINNTKKIAHAPTDRFSQKLLYVLQRVTDKSIFPLEENELTKLASYKYVLPKGIQEDTLQYLSEHPKQPLLKDVFLHLIDRNPILSDIQYGHRKELLVGGIASRINPNDIKYFIEVLDGSAAKNENDYNKKAMGELAKYIDAQVIESNADGILNQIENEFADTNISKLKQKFLSLGSYSLECWKLYTKVQGNRLSILEELQHKPVLVFRILKRIRQEKNGVRFGCVISPATFFNFFYR